VSAASDPPVTMRMKMSSRRGRAISMRPAGTALARRGMAAAGFVRYYSSTAFYEVRGFAFKSATPPDAGTRALFGLPNG